MNNETAKKKIAAAIRKMSRLSNLIASGEISNREKFIQTRNQAYSIVKWVDSETERGELLDQIEAVPFASALELGSSIQRAELAKETSRLRQEVREMSLPGTYEFEIAVYGTGGKSR